MSDNARVKSMVKQTPNINRGCSVQKYSQSMWKQTWNINVLKIYSTGSGSCKIYRIKFLIETPNKKILKISKSCVNYTKIGYGIRYRSHTTLLNRISRISIFCILANYISSFQTAVSRCNDFNAGCILFETKTIGLRAIGLIYKYVRTCIKSNLSYKFCLSDSLSVPNQYTHLSNTTTRNTRL